MFTSSLEKETLENTIKIEKGKDKSVKKCFTSILQKVWYYIFAFLFHCEKTIVNL